MAAEKPAFYAEAANLFLPGPGVVNGICRVTIRPVQGQVSVLELEVPKVSAPKSMDFVGRQWTDDGDDKPTKRK